jgi:capsular exopolysaccharide synthesis family protein
MSAGGGPVRLLRGYGLWIVLVTAVVTAAGYTVGVLAPVEYESAAIVVVEARVRANTTPVPPDMGTEKELAQSGLVVEPAARELGVGPGELLEGLEVSVAADANVLTFGYTAAEPATAQRRADALAESYVAYRNAGEAAAEKDGKATATTSTQHATLVTPAYLPATPVDRPIWIDLGLGLAIGLLLGVGTAIIRDRLSDRIRGRDDFARILGAPVLATVPRERRRRDRRDPRPVLLRAPSSPAAESFRYLRSRLQPVLHGGTTVLVTSAVDGEGRSTTAANLATALALSGRTVILLDADLRRPGEPTIFGAVGGAGLAEILAGRAGVDEALRDSPVPRLRLCTAGNAAADAGDLLDGLALRRIVRALRSRCDVVVIDSAPVLSVSDPIVLAAVSDRILLVGDQRRTERGAVLRALAELGETAEGMVGGVLLNAPRSAGGLAPTGRLAAPAAPGTVAAPDPVAAAPATPGRYGTPVVVPGGLLDRDAAVPAQRAETPRHEAPRHEAPRHETQHGEITKVIPSSGG